MKIYRFKYEDSIEYGILEEEDLCVVSGPIFEQIEITSRKIPIGKVELLSPVLPSKIVAVGRNYRDHARERGKPIPKEPLLFIKPSTSVIGPGDSIRLPQMSKKVDYEGELALVIRKKTYGLSDNSPVDDHILGYICFNDVTARDLQDRDGQFTRAKSFDTFACLGPCVATDVDPQALQVKTFLNGKLSQSENTKNLIFPIPYLVRYISNIMTLLPGDVITTGTPAGVGPLKAGDRVDVQIDGIGTLSNPVV